MRLKGANPDLNSEEIHKLQDRIGATSDGFWGPKSIDSCKKHLISLYPKINPWPKQDQKSLLAFYGKSGNESNIVPLGVSHLDIEYDGAQVSVIRCHKKVAESLFRILTEINGSNDSNILKEYAGVFNNRPMRNGSLPSLHARGAAIDLDPNRNGNMVHWPTQSSMPISIMEAFAKEGWLSAGAFWGRDSMHFQATQ
jgi:hypothetical protein